MTKDISVCLWAGLVRMQRKLGGKIVILDLSLEWVLNDVLRTSLEHNVKGKLVQRWENIVGAKVFSARITNITADLPQGLPWLGSDEASGLWHHRWSGDGGSGRILAEFSNSLEGNLDRQVENFLFRWWWKGNGRRLIWYTLRQWWPWKNRPIAHTRGTREPVYFRGDESARVIN